MEHKRILLKNATIINENADVIKGKDIVIDKGNIEFVADYNEALDTTGFDEVIDCSGYYVTPGLTNLHCHCAMNMFKGIAEDVDADSWFNKNIFPYESKLTSEDVYVGTKLGIAEMLNAGLTAFADHYFEENAVLQAVLDMGIRADIAPTLFGMAPNFVDRLEEVSEFCEKNRNISNRVAVRMGPHAPYTCPSDTLRAIVKCAEEMDLGLHMHISETREQVANSYEATGKTPYQVTYESGAFDRQMIIGHGLWIEEDDFKYINDKTWFALCPKTYEKLAMGTGLVFKNHEKLNFSFGTDGAASSNTLNTCEQARHFALLGKFEEWDPTAYETKAVWKSLMNGHNALSFNTGKIEAGYGADLVIWNLKKSNTWPIYHPVTSIIYSAEPSNVEFTMVDGVFLKRNGKLVIDEMALLEEGAKVQMNILARGRGEAQVIY